MPKSAKKSASKVNSTSATVAHPTKASKNGKRDAEDTIEKKIVDSKKQKIVGDDVASDFEKQKEELNINDAVTENGAVEAKNDEPESIDGDILDEEDAKPASEVSAVAEPAAKVKGRGSDDEAGSEEEEDDSSEENNADEEMVDAPSSKKAPETPETSQSTGSKTLFVGNLNFSVERSDILDFFKDAGEVVEVRLAMRDDRFAGYGHVEFATPDAVEKALKLNGELLLDRAVRLDVAKKKGAHNDNERSSQKSGQSQALTVFVRGFGTDDGFDGIRSTLEEHFGKCGEISRLSIPRDYESDGPKGVAFIDFSDREAFNKALELDGSEISGCTLTVEEAKQRGGGGGRGGWSLRKGRFGGRDGGRGRGRSGRGRGF